MSWFRPTRRAALAALGAAVAGCGFTPAYAPDGAALRLQNNVLVREPTYRLGYLMTRRIEERLGRPASPAFALDIAIGTDSVGTAQSGGATRAQVLGEAAFALKQIGTTTILTEGRVEAFTGYSNTGSTVSERAARSDAQERLMIILADQIVDRLILAAPTLE